MSKIFYQYLLIPFLLLALVTFFGACASFPLDSSESAAWAAGGIENAKGRIRIISVSAERSGEWGSLEKEINDLMPLLFSEESYLVVPSAVQADYSAEVKVREREYPDGWKMKRSLSAEVRLWVGDTTVPLPLSAGRSLIHGKQSLASSKTLSNMLRRAVKNAVSGLPPKGGEVISGGEL